MAFKSNKLEEKKAIKLYTGCGKFTPKLINPSAKDLSEFYGTTIDAEPEYLSEKEGVKTARISIYVENEETGMKNSLTYFISDEKQVSSTNKVVYINKYGQNAWLIPADVESGKLPENMSWFKTEGCRPAFKNEDSFTSVLRTILGVSNLKTAEKERDLSLAEGYLENPEKLFRGDFSEIKAYFKGGEKNTIGIVCGIKSSTEGKTYQYLYPNNAVISWSNNYDYVIKEIQERQQNGALASVDFGSFYNGLVEFSPDAAPMMEESSSAKLPDTLDF
jgi:hypothetical protein